MKIYSLYLTYRNIKRLKEISYILLKYGFSHVVENTDLKKFIPFYSRFLRKRMSQYVYGGVEIQLRMAFEELGPTFIKFGQALSRRNDLLPESFTKELNKLEDSVTPASYHTVMEKLNSVYGDRINEIFQNIDENPIASASLAQVYKAVLKDGTNVVLKVKRPGIGEIVENDFIILKFLGDFLPKYFPELRDFKMAEVIDEFGRMIKKELNFRNEQVSMERIKSLFCDDPLIVIPTVYKQLCTDDVIVMDHIESVKFTDREKILQVKVDLHELMFNGLEIFLTKVFESGIFHGDLHPGNLGLTADGRIVLYDFGNIGFLTRRVREMTKKLLVVLVNKDYESFVERLVEFGLLQDESNIYNLERELRDAFEYRSEVSLKQLDIAGLLMDIIDIARKYKLSVPIELLGFFRTVLLMDIVGRECVPDFSLNDVLYKVFEKNKDGFHTKDRIKDAFYGLNSLKNIVTGFPVQVDKLLKKMINDRFTVDFVHVNLEPLIEEAKKSSNRISISLIISSLIVGSALVFFSDKGPHILGYPVLGVLGFLSTMVLGLYLLLSIVRTGRP
jgi:ubiquinone biosynthesis protein